MSMPANLIKNVEQALQLLGMQPYSKTKKPHGKLLAICIRAIMSSRMLARTKGIVFSVVVGREVYT
jgi:hypothetical protein